MTVTGPGDLGWEGGTLKGFDSKAQGKRRVASATLGQRMVGIRTLKGFYKSRLAHRLCNPFRVEIREAPYPGWRFAYPGLMDVTPLG